MRARPLLTRRLALVGALVTLVVAGCAATTTGGTATVADQPGGPGTAGRSPEVSIVTVTWTPAPPTISAEDLAGPQYGLITAIDPRRSEITLDRISWFTGADAVSACDEDGVTDRADGWCTDFYYRNGNRAVRVVPVAPDAVIKVVQDGKQATPADLAAAAAEVADAPDNPWRLVVTDGKVTELEEIPPA